MDARDQSKSGLLLRVLRFPLVRMLLLTLILYYLYLSGLSFRQGFAETPMQSVAVVAFMVANMLAIYALFVRLVERRPVSELAVPGMGRELGLGLLIGAGLYTACVAILAVLGIYRIDGFNSWHMLFPALWYGISSGVFEELLFRGVLMRITEEVFGSWVGLAVSALVFGLVHLNNPEATLQGALFISVEFGLLLGAAYLLTRRLWMSMGIHAAWNYTQAAVFAGAGSGNEAPQGFVKATIDGPELLTGGAFGIEGSLIAFVLATTTGVIMLVMAMRRGHIVPPLWRREA
jgi:membrane protease YdiL (CAAX protease family)